MIFLILRNVLRLIENYTCVCFKSDIPCDAAANVGRQFTIHRMPYGNVVTAGSKIFRSRIGSNFFGTALSALQAKAKNVQFSSERDDLFYFHKYPVSPGYPGIPWPRYWPYSIFAGAEDVDMLRHFWLWLAAPHRNAICARRHSVIQNTYRMVDSYPLERIRLSVFLRRR